MRPRYRTLLLLQRNDLSYRTKAANEPRPEIVVAGRLSMSHLQLQEMQLVAASLSAAQIRHDVLHTIRDRPTANLYLGIAVYRGNRATNHAPPSCSTDLQIQTSAP